jgi:hypothetical protein
LQHLWHFAVVAVDVGGPVADAAVGVEDQASGAVASNATRVGGALQEGGAVVLDTDDLSGLRAFPGFWDDWCIGDDWTTGDNSTATTSLGWFRLWGFDWHLAVEEDINDGFQKGVFAFTAERALEVIQIQGPDHTTSKAFVFDVFRLDSDGVNIVVCNPLVSSISIHAFVFVVVDCGPATLEVLANLVIGDESLLSGVFAGGACTLGGCAHSGLAFVHQSKAAAVGAHAHDKLVGGEALLHEVVDGPVDVKEAVVSGFVCPVNFGIRMGY